MHACTHPCTGLNSKTENKRCFFSPSPHLCVLHSDSKLQCERCATIPPLLSVCVSLFLTRSSTCSHRVALVTLCCRELSQTESEGEREGLGWQPSPAQIDERSFQKRLQEKMYKNISLLNILLCHHSTTSTYFFYIRPFTSPFLLPSSCKTFPETAFPFFQSVNSLFVEFFFFFFLSFSLNVPL